MATAEELLNSISKNQVSVLSEDDGIFAIDAESRTITVPDSERLFGVKGDKDVERKYFQCPKIVGDNIDLSQHQIYVSYVFTTTENNTAFPTIGNGLYLCEVVEVSGDNITFSWLLSGNVFANPGFIAFKVMAKKSEGGELKTKWNTAPAIGTVLLTVPDGEEIAEEYPDIINQLLTKMESVEQIATPEAMQGYVNAYLEENPVTGGMTEEQEQQLNKNTEDISSLSEEIAKLQASGLTTAQVNALDDMFKKCAFTGNVSAEYTAFKQAFGIESGGGEEEPTDKTLTSISVTYAGGEVTVGTALTDLTGITVTAHYSDGSTDTITGYTLSGEIVEGKNTIIVSYGGKTTTFMVTGVASGGTESNIAYLPVAYKGSEYWAYFPEVVAGDVYYIAYNISQYAALRDFSPWASVSASETTWTYEKYNDNYYKITFVTDYGDIGLIANSSWADLEYSTVKYSKNAVPVE